MMIIVGASLSCIEGEGWGCREKAGDGRFRRGEGLGGVCRVGGGEGVGDGRSRAGGGEGVGDGRSRVWSLACRCSWVFSALLQLCCSLHVWSLACRCSSVSSALLWLSCSLRVKSLACPASVSRILLRFRWSLSRCSLSITITTHCTLHDERSMARQRGHVQRTIITWLRRSVGRSVGRSNHVSP